MTREPQTGKGDVIKTIVVSCVVGAVAIGVTLFLAIRISRANRDSLDYFADVAREGFGYRLMAKTPELIGPDVSDPSLRYAGNRLSCGSCHLHQGDDPGAALSLSQAVYNYPKFSARTAAIRTLEDRVNECMTRSMNGRPLPRNSPQMLAITDWVRSVAAKDASVNGGQHKTVEPVKFRAPDRAAKVITGKEIFEQRCAECHGYNGAGRRAANPTQGYVFPPLWGPDSFNTGAGMHRLLTAAPFIKSRMPLGNPNLTDDEAYDVAAYINAQPRPEMSNLEADFPDKRTKQVDAAYGPFVDPFPLEQHRLGPFRPIEAYYKKLKESSK